MSRQARNLIGRLGKLTAAEKEKYYKACSVAGPRLDERGYGDLNIQQCEYICEMIAAGKKPTMGGVVRLATKLPDEPSTQPEQDLFSSQDGESSSKSGPPQS